MSPKRVVLVSFAGGNASTTTGPLEVLELASTRSTAVDAGSISLSVVTKDGSPVQCGGRVTIVPSASMTEVESPDLIFLAGMPCNVEAVIRANGDVIDWVVGQRDNGVAIAAVCPSQVLLADSGHLDCKTVAMHWSLMDEVRARWPAVAWTANRLVAEDAGIYSCCGTYAAIDLALYIVDRFCGENSMTECARYLLADLPRTRHNVPPPLFGFNRTDDLVMARVEGWIQRHYGEMVHFEALAQQFNMSWRNFYRRFTDAFGDSPKVYLQKIRLNAARKLLEANEGTIDQVARAVGYDNPAFFRILFKRHTNMTPSAYRENYRFRSLVGDRHDGRAATKRDPARAAVNESIGAEAHE